jgi:hypothetical protein
VVFDRRRATLAAEEQVKIQRARRAAQNSQGKGKQFEI